MQQGAISFEAVVDNIPEKIEKVKELLLYDELNLTQISYRLNYSSVGHLSNQFKKMTGLTPSHFKKMKDKRRSPIEDIGIRPGEHREPAEIKETL